MEPTITFEEYMAIVWQIIDITSDVAGYILDVLMIIAAIYCEKHFTRMRNALFCCRAAFDGTTEAETKLKMGKKYDLLIENNQLCLRTMYKQKWVLPLKDIADVDFRCRTQNPSTSYHVTIHKAETYINLDIDFNTQEKLDLFKQCLKNIKK